MASVEIAIAAIEVARQTARMEALMDAEQIVRDRVDHLKPFRLSEKSVLLDAANAIAALNVIPEEAL